MVSEWEYAARDGFNFARNEMQAWLEEIGAERVDVHYDGVGVLVDRERREKAAG